jgi:MoxR-like ATPase
MRAGDRALFWLSGEQAGIYATGWLTTDPYQSQDSWHVDVNVWWNTYDEPFLKDKLVDNPALQDLGPIKFPPATSFEVTPEQWAEFKRLAIERENKMVPPPPPREEGLSELAQRLYLEPVSELEEIISLLDDRPQAIFYGPPGTGKTWVAQRLAEWLARSKDRVKLVQFHPSYAYEDFIEGWRPTADGNFELKDGPLKRMAEQAAADPDHTFVLVIDEINRANLSKVLGELFFLLEYRKEDVTLQYSEEKFSLPTNLKIIGTMNTADRSIALVDAALRRRFHFHPFFPDRPPIQGILNRWLTQNQPELIEVAGLVDRANELLDDRNMAIGPSHFMREGLTEGKVKQIWRRSVIPFIEDQFFDEPARVKQFTYDALTGTDTDAPEDRPGDEDADASSS